VYCELAKARPTIRVESRLEHLHEWKELDSGGLAIFEQVHDIHPPIATLQPADEHLPIPDTIGRFRLRNARIAPSLA
jgi:hypothetical protein